MIQFIFFNESNDIWLWHKSPLIKRLGGCESFTVQWHGGRWEGMAITGSDEGECITGSDVLYERDREGFTKKEMTWKQESQSEREVTQPLESTLRLTPSYSPLFSICKYSMSSEVSRLIAFEGILFIIIKAKGAWEENTFGLLWSHNNW